MNALNQLELPILHAIQDAIGCSFLDTFFSLITRLGDGGIFWIILAIVLLCFRKTRRAGVAMAVALIIGLCVTNLGIKPLAARIRPYVVDPSISLIIPPESEFSFPSGHTSTSFECAFVLAWYHRKAGIAAIVLAAVIAFSRLYLMVHYPTDVLAGIVIGALVAAASCVIGNRIVKKTKMPIQ